MQENAIVDCMGSVTWIAGLKGLARVSIAYRRTSNFRTIMANSLGIPMGIPTGIPIVSEMSEMGHKNIVSIRAHILPRCS